MSDDPNGLKLKLTKHSNGVLASLSGNTAKIFLVEQASLGRSSERARAEIYQKDGLHLTKKGLNFYNSNIISSLKECYPDTEGFNKSDESRHTDRNEETEHTNQGGQRGFHTQSGSDRSQRWINYGEREAGTELEVAL